MPLILANSLDPKNVYMEFLKSAYCIHHTDSGKCSSLRREEANESQLRCNCLLGIEDVGAQYG
jgi:hypothetical protein